MKRIDNLLVFVSTPLATAGSLTNADKVKASDAKQHLALNPVRARMVADVADYPWSSFAAQASQNEGYDWVDLDPCFRSLGATREEQNKRYVDFVHQSIPVREWKLIKDAVQRGQLTGGGKFTEEIDKTYGLRIEMRGWGWPELE